MDLDTFKEILELYYNITGNISAHSTLAEFELLEIDNSSFNIQNHQPILESIGDALIIIANTKLARKLYPDHLVSNNNKYLFINR